MPTSEDFSQLALHFTDPVQYSYEVIRGIMLADGAITAPSEATGLDRDGLGNRFR